MDIFCIEQRLIATGHTAAIIIPLKADEDIEVNGRNFVEESGHDTDFKCLQIPVEVCAFKSISIGDYSINLGIFNATFLDFSLASF